MTDRVALITGGGTGIGRATARELAAQGWQVAVTGRRGDTLTEAIDPLRSRGLAITGDVCVEGDARAMVSQTVEAFGRLDLLVNNAALYAVAPVMDDSEEAWRRQFDVNLHGPQSVGHAVQWCWGGVETPVA